MGSSPFAGSRRGFSRGLLEGEARAPRGAAAVAVAMAAVAAAAAGACGAFSRAATANASSSSGVALGTALALRLRRWGLLLLLFRCFSGVLSATAIVDLGGLFAGEEREREADENGNFIVSSRSRQSSHELASPQAGHSPLVGITPPPEESWRRKRSARHSGWERARQEVEADEEEEVEAAQGTKSVPGSIGREQTEQRRDSSPSPSPSPPSPSPSPSELSGSLSSSSPSSPAAAAAPAETATLPTTSVSTGAVSSRIPRGRPLAASSAGSAAATSCSCADESTVTVRGMHLQAGALSMAKSARRVHVEMGIDKRRAEQLAVCVQRFVGRDHEPGRDFDDAAFVHRHRHMGAPVG